MRLTIIGSSSEGNAYVLHNESEALLLEAGMPFKKALAALDFNISKVAGCLVTHEHGDHASRAAEYMDNGVHIYASRGTCDAIKAKGGRIDRLHPLSATDAKYPQFNCRNFTVTPFATQHDAAEPLGFILWHPETGGVLFATDTYYIAPRFSHLSNILIECNYSQAQLEAHLADGMEPGRYQRVRESHMSLDTCRETLQANDLTGVINIVLIHLSKDHANPQEFRNEIRRATGKSVTIAEPGLTIDFNDSPF